MIEAKAYGYRVVVERTVVKTGGMLITLPDKSTTDSLQSFTVIDVGTPKVLLAGGEIPIKLKVGDRIGFDPQQAISLTPAWMFGGRELWVVNVEGIFAEFTGEPEVPPARIVRGSAKTELVH